VENHRAWSTLVGTATFSTGQATRWWWCGWWWWWWWWGPSNECFTRLVL